MVMIGMAIGRFPAVERQLGATRPLVVTTGLLGAATATDRRPAFDTARRWLGIPRSRPSGAHLPAGLHGEKRGRPLYVPQRALPPEGQRRLGLRVRAPNGEDGRRRGARDGPTGTPAPAPQRLRRLLE